MTTAIRTNFRKSFDINKMIPRLVAPNTFRMPISFFLCSAEKVASPKAPKQEIRMANSVKIQNKLLSFLLCLVHRSKTFFNKLVIYWIACVKAIPGFFNACYSLI